MTHRVVILEPDLDGHHAFWLALLIEAHRREGWMIDVITARDRSRLRDQCELRGYDLEGVRLRAARAQDAEGLLAEAQEVAAETGARRIFIAFLDRFWGAILARAGSWSTGARLAGIWFHPHALDGGWRWAPPLGKRWKLRGRLHRFLRSGRGAQVLEAVFFPAAEPVKQWKSVAPAVPVHLLPDPWERRPRLGRTEARRFLGLPEERTIFLHLGSAERRKGFPDVVAAFAGLSEAPRRVGAHPPLLLRVGTNTRLAAADAARLEALRARGGALVVDELVSADRLMEFFAAADWVLLPYRKFRYSSGVLSNAIGADRPVIAADNGYVGALVRQQGLGLLYRHCSVRALQQTLRRALVEGPAVAPRVRAAVADGETFISALRRANGFFSMET